MEPKAFGEKLKYYRRQTQDKLRGGYLTQARLAELICEYFGLDSFPFQHVSHWEQGKHLPKDRATLQALVCILINYQGIKSIEEANAWLNLGGYASLSTSETLNIKIDFSPLPPPTPEPDVPNMGTEPLHLSAAALPPEPSLPTPISAAPPERPLGITELIFKLTQRILAHDGYTVLVSLGGGVSTWLLLKSFFEWPFTHEDAAVMAHIKLGLANFFIPMGIHLFLKTDKPALPLGADWLSHKLFINAAARVMYYITLMIYLVVTSLAYWSGFWPWPLGFHFFCWVSFWLVTYSFIKEVKYWSQPLVMTFYLELVMIVTGQILTLLAWFTYSAETPIYWIILLFLPLGLLLAKFNPSPRTVLFIILALVGFACSLMGLQIIVLKTSS